MLFMYQVHIKTEIANIVSKPPVRWNNTYYSQSTYSMGNRHIILSWTEKNQISMSAASANGSFTPGDTLCMGPDNERRYFYVTSSSTGPAHPQEVHISAHMDSPRLTPFITKQRQLTSTVYWCIASKLKAPRNLYWMSNIILCVEIFIFCVCHHVFPKRHSQLDHKLNGL